jgi:two-component system, response regulator PdtaR
MDCRASVLLAEDELLIRVASALALRDEGFEVLEAEHAGTALAILEARAPSVHVLCTDVHMPGPMDGVELAHHTSRTWPWIALLVVSARALDRALPRNSRFVPKPYEHEHIIRHIRQLVGSGIRH